MQENLSALQSQGIIILAKKRMMLRARKVFLVLKSISGGSGSGTENGVSNTNQESEPDAVDGTEEEKIIN